MGTSVDTVKYYLLLHFEVRWKFFHFPSVDMLYEVWHTWGHVQRHGVYILTWNVVSFSGSCESCCHV